MQHGELARKNLTVFNPVQKGAVVDDVQVGTSKNELAQAEHEAATPGLLLKWCVVAVRH